MQLWKTCDDNPILITQRDFALAFYLPDSHVVRIELMNICALRGLKCSDVVSTRRRFVWKSHLGPPENRPSLVQRIEETKTLISSPPGLGPSNKNELQKLEDVLAMWMLRGWICPNKSFSYSKKPAAFVTYITCFTFDISSTSYERYMHSAASQALLSPQERHQRLVFLPHLHSFELSGGVFMSLSLRKIL